jgi:tRNA nucleotidyltransferase/poly(A) polymerase
LPPLIKMTELHFDNLPRPLAEAAKTVSLRLSQAGYQAWIVGGAVRDLWLGRVPKDIDITTDALPDEVEALFPKTSAVGKAFGTILVHCPRAQLGEAGVELEEGTFGVDIEVTTFRSDGEYVDGRRPLEVSYADNLEEDASRRDFTCNALFANILDGELRDPEGGLEDLKASRLRAVGQADQRFVEDGLRLMRLARFEGRFGLTPDQDTLRGARAAVQAIRGVSPERIRSELEGIFQSADPGRALGRLLDLQLFDLMFVPPADPTWVDWSQRCALFAQVKEQPMTLSQGLSLLLGPDPRPQANSELAAWSTQCLDHLRPSRGTKRAVLGVWKVLAGIAALQEEPNPRRCARVALMRSPGWSDALLAVEAWRAAVEPSGILESRSQRVAALEAERQSLSPEELEPAPWLTSEDLAQTRIPRGPRWGRLLQQAADLQLDLKLTDRAQALAWLQDQERREDS